MKISKKLQDAINKQIAMEFEASHMYLAMAAWFETQNLPGFASWMKIQAGEENEHAMKFFNYVVERGGDVELTDLKLLKSSWKSPTDAIQDAYDHECKVSTSINEIGELAKAEKDNATYSFLGWFFDEQVEEEATADELLQQLKLAGESKGNLMYIDRHVGKRAKE
jgi:ferritin